MEEIDSARRAPFGSNPHVGEAGRATQLRILAAANEAFAANGYARTSVESITDLAGCSRPTFYQYFSGKEDLHRRLAGRFGAELAALLDQMGPITADRAGRDELCRWLEGLSDVHARYQAIADNFAAAVRTDDQMVAGSNRLSTAYRARLAEMIVDPRPSSLAHDALAAAVNATAYGASLYRARVSEISEHRLAAALADVIHRTLFGPIPDVNLGPRVPSDAPATVTDTSPAADETDPRQSRGRATRARLMDAATVAFGTLGFDGVRIDDIAAEAGVSHGTFYRYFSDKDSIFSEQADAAADELAALLARWPLADDDHRQWAKEFYELFGRRGGIISCLPEARAAGLDCAARSRETTSTALRQGLDQRSFGDVDADVVVCFSLTENLASTAFRGLGITVDDAIEATALILRQGVFGETA